MKFICAFLCALLCATQAFAQQTAPDPALLQTLISEIRQLRMSIDRSANLLPKMQLAVSRLQNQQERVDRRERELQGIRNQISEQTMAATRFQEMVKQFEEKARVAQDPATRKNAEDSLDSMKMAMKQQTSQEQRNRVLESEALAQLRSEQDKLHELEQQLDRLDKAAQ